MRVPLHNLTPQDQEIAARFIGSGGSIAYAREPDLVIAPDGEPYLYRWHIVERNKDCNVYFHMQIDSDPERPLHDHPWDNTSVILAGGYDELRAFPHPVEHSHLLPGTRRILRKGDVVHRKAEEAHRLILPDGFLYTLTLFTTGPRRRDWGFWFPEGWRNADDVLYLDPETRRSIMKPERRTGDDRG